MLALRLLVLGLGVWWTAGCRIEDRTPTGSRSDERAIQHVLAMYVRRLSNGDWPGVRSLFWREGSYAGSLGPGAPPGHRLVVPIDSALEALAASLRKEPPGRYDVRVLRTDFRQEGDLATAWLTVRRRMPLGAGTVERDWMEHIVLRRIGGEWRILSVAATQVRRRR